MNEARPGQVLVHLLQTGTDTNFNCKHTLSTVRLGKISTDNFHSLYAPTTVGTTHELDIRGDEHPRYM